MVLNFNPGTLVDLTKKARKSWHSGGFGKKRVNATRDILTTKVQKSKYFGVKIHFGERSLLGE